MITLSAAHQAMSKHHVICEINAVSNAKRIDKQRGVALIMAMLIVSLVAAISVDVSWRFDLSLARSANRWHGMQAQSYLEGGEALAKLALEEDAADNEYDHLGEPWAGEGVTFDTDEGGYVRGKVEDAQGRININSLGAEFNKDKNGSLLPLPSYLQEPQRRFIRLLQTLNLGTDDEPVYLDVEQAKNILEAVKDWIDVDSDVSGFGGAEADYYRQLEPAMTISNGPMASVTELQILKDVTPALYERLLPYVIALPDASIGLNINTVSLEVMRSLNSKDVLTPLLAEDAQKLKDEIDPEVGLAQVDDFLALPSADILFPSVGNNSSLDVTGLVTASEYFLYFGEVAVGDHTKRGNSLLKRTEGTVETIRRTNSSF